MITLHTTRALSGHLAPSSERFPRPLRAGQVHCPACRKPVSLIGGGKLRSHNDLFGWHCYNTDAPEPA